MRFDLDALAAPIEALRPELDTAYDALDAEWREVHAKLRSLPIPCPIVMPINNWTEDSKTTLEWRKQNNGWRFCIVNKKPLPKPHRGKSQAVTVKPFEQWTGHNRLNLLRRMPEFFECVREQTQQFINRASKVVTVETNSAA